MTKAFHDKSIIVRNIHMSKTTKTRWNLLKERLFGKKCPSCNTKNKYNSHYCLECGFNFQSYSAKTGIEIFDNESDTISIELDENDFLVYAEEAPITQIVDNISSSTISDVLVETKSIENPMLREDDKSTTCYSHEVSENPIKPSQTKDAPYQENYEMKVQGEIVTTSGQIKRVPFVNTDKKSKILLEEQLNLEKFYQAVNNVIFSYKRNIKGHTPVDFHDKEAWEDEMLQRRDSEYFEGKVTRLENTLDKPYIGRMCVHYTDEDETEDVYVGKEYISDGTGKPLVCSWYSPIGNKIYDDVNTSWRINNQQVELLLKRNIVINNRKVQSVFESFNKFKKGTNKEIADEFLLKVLKSKRSNARLSDIVETIQTNQNQIITASFNKNLVMQGCAGSGKTMVLFHRLKYMLGNNINTDKRVCIITPSERFNGFVKPLLKDLRLSNIRPLSITDYYSAILEGYTAKNDNSYSWKTLLQDNNNIGIKPLKIEDDDSLPNDIVDYFYSNEFFNNVNSLAQLTIKPINKSTFEANKKIKNQLGQIDIFQALLGKNELEILPNYERVPGIVHKCELFALCLFYYKRCGIYKYKANPSKKNKDENNNKKEESETQNTLFTFLFDLIMIDEAQDISESEYKLLKAINKTTIFNLFGDVDQMINRNGLKKWQDIATSIGDFELYEFNRNYRNSTEIIDYVNATCQKKMENVGYDSFKVLDINEQRLTKALLNEKLPRKAIICSRENKLVWSDKYPILKNYIFTVQEIKGMEFDCAFVSTKNLTSKEAYVALTRALDKLIIINENI